MQTSAASELKQIKIQDQVRDLREREETLRTTRRRSIGSLLQGLLLIPFVLMISNISFVFSLFLGTLDFSKFTMPGYIVLILLILFIGLAFLVYRIYSSSKELSQIELSIKKRLYALKKMSGAN